MSYSVSIKIGNVVEEEADFIVNASNTKLLLGSGVSMAFKRHCGVALQKEMTQILNDMGGKLSQGSVILTSSATATNFKYALHAAVISYNKEDSKNPTLSTIKLCLKNIEQILISKNPSHKIKLALPLMGCGVGGLDKKDIIKLYKAFFAKDIAIDVDVVIYGYSQDDFYLLNR